jgi:hypothetical protein
MIVRYGFYEGQVRPDRQAEFDTHFRDVVIPGLARMPGILSVRLLRGIASGSIQPRFHHVIELTCRDEDALVEAMLSEQRRALQTGPWEMMDFYQGATPHANFTVAMTLEGQGAGDGNPVPPAEGRRKLAALARVGRSGQEKPVAVYDDGEIRDVSIFVSEIDRALIGAGWMEAVAALDPGRLPRVDPAARKGPCVEYHGRIVATSMPGTQAPFRAGLRAGRLAGANDPMPLPREGAFTCRAGIAAIVGASSPEPTISGVCLFLEAERLADPGMDEESRAVAASAPGLLSLGPLLVATEEWRPGRRPLQLSVNGREFEEGDFSEEAVRESVRLLNRAVELDTGDVVLVGAHRPSAPPAMCARFAAGDVIAVASPGLGRQERRCC